MALLFLVEEVGHFVDRVTGVSISSSSSNISVLGPGFLLQHLTGARAGDGALVTFV